MAQLSPDSEAPSPPLTQYLNPKLIQMSGAPGSGKTTTANLLAPHINAFIIPHDHIKSQLLDSGISFTSAGKIAYNLDWVLASNAISQGFSVIIDTPCLYPEILEQGRALARTHGYRYCYVEIRTDDLDMLDERLRARVNPLRAQRTGIDEVPDGAGVEEAKDAAAAAAARERFRAMVDNPCRPDSNFVIVDACSSLDERVGSILEQVFSMPDDED